MDKAARLEIRPGSEPHEFEIDGELDVATCDDLRRHLEAMPEDATVTLDLAAVSFIDSSALRVIIEHHHRLEGGGGALRLRNPSVAATRILEISGLEDHLNIV